MMATLVHGTTRHRAERIIRNGPDPRYLEPGGVPSNDGFSTYLESGPFMFKRPEEYATGKAHQFPGEGGPVILVIEGVPDDVLSAANRLGLLPLKSGVVQFDHGDGLEELLAVWNNLTKTIRDV
jgi:hypothetical protein